MLAPELSMSMQNDDPIAELRRENAQLRYLIGSIVESVQSLRARIDDLEHGEWLDAIPTVPYLGIVPV